jgi:CheY-like chemotaxis protein
MSSGTTSNRRVLLVEDSADSRNAMADFLQNEGYEVVAVANGLEALNHLRWSWRPACVVLDMRLPLMTGWEFRTAIEQDQALRSIPIIGVTGGRWKPGDASGFAALLAKPIDYDALREALKRCVDGGAGADPEVAQG